MRAIKIIKNSERKASKTQRGVKSLVRSGRSPQKVESWVVEFKKNRRGESLVAFDSLFKENVSQSGQTD